MRKTDGSPNFGGPVLLTFYYTSVVLISEVLLYFRGPY
jgi:hypothetical protein